MEAEKRSQNTRNERNDVNVNNDSGDSSPEMKINHLCVEEAASWPGDLRATPIDSSTVSIYLYFYLSTMYIEITDASFSFNKKSLTALYRTTEIGNYTTRNKINLKTEQSNFPRHKL